MKWAIQRFGPTLRAQSGSKIVETETAAALAGSKYVLVYVSAHFCPPCRKLTPLLAAMYEDLQEHCESNARPHEVHIVFVSADHTEDEYEEYYGMQMPWHALPYHCAERQEILQAFGDKGIPRLVLFDSATGAVVDPDARQRIIKAKTLVDLTVQ